MTSDPPARLTIQTLSSLDEVDQGAWDALSPQDPLASHGWLRVIEDELSEEVEVLYLLGWENRELVAGLPCYCCYRRTRLMDPDQLMYGRFRRLPELMRLSFVPTMVVGPYRSYGPKILLSPTLDAVAQRRVRDELLQTAEGVARARGLSVQMPKISAQDSETLGLVDARRYHRTRDFPIAYLDVEWDDFDGYLAHIRTFSPKMRRNIKEEMNRFRRAGVRVEELHEPGAHRDALLRITQDHYQRLNRVTFPFSDSFLVRLKERLGHEVAIYGAFLKARLIGFVLKLERGRTAYLPMTGIDRLRTGNEATYFNLCYYLPIRDAIDRGLDRLYYGSMLHSTKVRRGCRMLGLHHAYLGSSLPRHLCLEPWFAFHSAWMRRRVIPLEDLQSLRKGALG